MSWRRLRVLLVGLPRDSLLNRVLHGRDVVDWTPEVEMLAKVKDAITFGNYGGKGPRPKPLTRPSEPKRVGRTNRPQKQVRALLASYSAPEE